MNVILWNYLLVFFIPCLYPSTCKNTYLRNWSCVVPLCMNPLAITVAVWQILTLTASSKASFFLIRITISWFLWRENMFWHQIPVFIFLTDKLRNVLKSFFWKKSNLIFIIIITIVMGWSERNLNPPKGHCTQWHALTGRTAPCTMYN